jgi:hypothetical protein
MGKRISIWKTSTNKKTIIMCKKTPIMCTTKATISNKKPIMCTTNSKSSIRLTPTIPTINTTKIKVITKTMSKTIAITTMLLIQAATITILTLVVMTQVIQEEVMPEICVVVMVEVAGGVTENLKQFCMYIYAP